MSTISPFERLLLFSASVATMLGCQAVLGIEDATVDPALVSADTSEPRESPATHDSANSAANPDGMGSDTAPAEPADTAPADSSNSDTASTETPVCAGFDNSRVKRRNPDGSLPPLPEVVVPPASTIK